MGEENGNKAAEKSLEKGPSVICAACQKKRRTYRTVIGELIYGPVFSLIQKKYPDVRVEQNICFICLDRFRAEYVEDVLETERGELTTIEQEVVQSFRDHELITENLNARFESGLSVGEKLADRITAFGGSWTFVLLFAAVFTAWIVLNATALYRSFDPFPFTLLNLALSFIAAIQAPIIMMSQNRQAARERIRSEHEYQVNLKAELEIRHLHRKVDQLLTQQWRRLLEIQHVQIELMKEILESKKGRGDKSPN